MPKSKRNMTKKSMRDGSLFTPQFILLLVCVLVLSADAQDTLDNPVHGTFNAHSTDVVTELLQNTTALETSATYPINTDVSVILQEDDATTYAIFDRSLARFENGLLDGPPSPIDSDCDPQRILTSQYSEYSPPYVHCRSTASGVPQYSVNGQMYTLPLFGLGYLEQETNSILSAGVDSDGVSFKAIVVVYGDATSLDVYTIGVGNTQYRRTVDLQNQCDRITWITYQDPINDRIRFVITCFQDEVRKYYATQLTNDFELDSAEQLRYSGNALSLVTSGDNVCMMETSMLTCFISTQPTRVPDIRSFDGTIASLDFFSSASGLFLLVQVNGSEQTIFEVSGGIGERFSLPGSQALCSEERCLPFVVTGSHLLLFRHNGSYYRANLYDLNDPLSEPVFRGNTRFRTKVVVFHSLPLPVTMATSSPTSETTSAFDTTTENTTPPHTATSQDETVPTTPETIPTTKADSDISLATTSPIEKPSTKPVPTKTIILGVVIPVGVLILCAVVLVLSVLLRNGNKRIYDPEKGYLHCCSSFLQPTKKTVEERELHPDQINGGHPKQETDAKHASPNLSAQSSASSVQQQQQEVKPLAQRTGKDKPSEMVLPSD